MKVWSTLSALALFLCIRFVCRRVFAVRMPGFLQSRSHSRFLRRNRDVDRRHFAERVEIAIELLVIPNHENGESVWMDVLPRHSFHVGRRNFLNTRPEAFQEVRGVTVEFVANLFG